MTLHASIKNLRLVEGGSLHLVKKILGMQKSIYKEEWVDKEPCMDIHANKLWVNQWGYINPIELEKSRAWISCEQALNMANEKF